MQSLVRRRLHRVCGLVFLAASASLLAACASPKPDAPVTKKRSKEYFAESEYGVKASPRVATGKRMPRGGGRDQIGKPYQVRGKWYYPKEDKRYSKVGSASWYGDAFHGRLTANGEVYDTAHLTAAHPTMPLPSYARVTNMANGSSVIVRVNDRGPYHGGRIIDLSQRAAEMLDFAQAGTARVKVDYVGRAPLEGHDDHYLMASYQPGNKAPDPSVGLPTGVMIAMDGRTPSGPVDAGDVPFPVQLASTQPALAYDGLVLPEVGPVVPERPGTVNLPAQVPFAIASLSYAQERVQSSALAFASLERPGLSSHDVARSWKRTNPDTLAAIGRSYIAAGSYDQKTEAGLVATRLEAFGRVEIQQSRMDGKGWYSVNVYPDGRAGIDELLWAAWDQGAIDAIAVRE